MTPGFRFSDENVADIRALAAFLKERTGFVPWLSGTSMGALSASYAGVRLKDAVAGLVLSSSVTRVNRKWDVPATRIRGALDAGLESLRVPVLVVRHRDDGCVSSPPDNGPRMLEALWAAPKKELLTFEGGLPPQSGPCEAKSQHGYLGLEDEVVAGISAFILRNTPSGPPAR
jgi:pimeloyl-ACP methyl ester carboxylesterase